MKRAGLPRYEPVFEELLDIALSPEETRTLLDTVSEQL